MDFEATRNPLDVVVRVKQLLCKDKSDLLRRLMSDLGYVLFDGCVAADELTPHGFEDVIERRDCRMQRVFDKKIGDHSW